MLRTVKIERISDEHNVISQVKYKLKAKYKIKLARWKRYNVTYVVLT